MKNLIHILIFILTSININADGIYDITIHVKGLVCDFCARSVEKTFGKNKAIESILVDLDNGIISLNLKVDASVSDEEIANLVESSGGAYEIFVNDDLQVFSKLNLGRFPNSTYEITKTIDDSIQEGRLR